MLDSALVWFRRELRLDDHAALSAALAQARRVYCAFVFDTAILEPLRAGGTGACADRRVDFIHGALRALDASLREHGSGLIVRHGAAAEVLPALAAELGVEAVYTHRDADPYAIERDAQVERALAVAGRRFERLKDTTIFERGEVLTAGGTPFSVFTPYRNAWLRRLSAADLAEHDTRSRRDRLAPPPVPHGVPDIGSIGFATTDLAALRIEPGEAGARRGFDEFLGRIDRYREARDFPAVRGPSYLSVHLRFGTISIRALAREAHARAEAGSDGASTWRSELIWRDFYHQVLFHHPRVATHAFRPEYDRIVWDDDEDLFAAWCEGRTGYPLVDAAMAQINRTGYMHNRLRMVVASFLTKDLGIDWRRGEAWFARQLIDFDLAANNGGWQWAASSGCDAQPYFRIFNPVTQSEKFDPEGRFIRRYLPQLADFTEREIHAPWLAPPERQRAAGCVIGTDYPAPVVDHAQARARTLARYAVVRG